MSDSEGGGGCSCLILFIIMIMGAVMCKRQAEHLGYPKEPVIEDRYIDIKVYNDKDSLIYDLEQERRK